MSAEHHNPALHFLADHHLLPPIRLPSLHLAGHHQHKPAEQMLPVNTERRAPRKRAVLVGINYKGTSNELHGCCNDNVYMFELLQNGGADIDIHRLDDVGFNGAKLHDSSILPPTKANILAALDWLVADAHAGDHLMFHMSSHGLRIHDQQEGEISAVVPIDYMQASGWEAGMLNSHDIRQRIDRLPEGVKMLAIVDACHSESILDLPYEYEHIEQNYIAKVNPHVAPTKADVISISGCLDTQTSSDAFLEPPKPRRLTAQGALSGTLIQLVYNNPSGLSYSSFMKQLHAMLAEDHFSQYSVLASGKNLDMNSTCMIYDFLPSLAQ
jgi:hypothetical protein